MALGSGAAVAAARVVLRVDKGDFTRDLATAEREVKGSADNMERHLGAVSRGALAGSGALHGLARTAFFASGSFLAAGGVVAALKSSVEAASNAETAQRSLQTQLRALGISYQDHAKQIDDVIRKQAQLSGFTDVELTGSLTQLVRATHDVNKALADNALAADIARAKHISLESAAMVVTKAEMGNVGALHRMGIEVEKVTTAQDALKASHEKATRAQIAAAKAADLVATKQQTVATLQKVFAGQAQAYGQTSAGSMDRFHSSVERLQESIGRGLMPALANVLNRLTDWINRLNDSGKAQEYVSKAVAAAKTAFDALKSVVDAVWPPLKKTADALNDASQAILGQSGLKTAIEALTGFAILRKVAGLAALFGVGKAGVAGEAEAAATKVGLLGKIIGGLKGKSIQIQIGVAYAAGAYKILQKVLFKDTLGADYSAPQAAGDLLPVKRGGKWVDPNTGKPLDPAGQKYWNTHAPAGQAASANLGKFARVDQGVDFVANAPVQSIGAGVVSKVSPAGSWAGGTGQAVYIKLDKPVTVNGRTYSEVYYAEEKPLVRRGQRVRMGDPVMAAGGNEIGFARNGQPVAPLVGGLGAGTQKTQAGQDFLAYVSSAGPLMTDARNRQLQSSKVYVQAQALRGLSRDQMIAAAAQAYGIDPNLYKALILRGERSGASAVSPRGAMGYAQLMPGTAAGLGVTDPMNPAQNLLGGAKYLAQLLKQFPGRNDIAVAAYNAGPGAVQKFGGMVPPYAETRGYVQRVLGAYQRYGQAPSAATPSRPAFLAPPEQYGPTLAEAAAHQSRLKAARQKLVAAIEGGLRPGPNLTGGLQSAIAAIAAGQLSAIAGTGAARPGTPDFTLGAYPGGLGAARGYAARSQGAAGSISASEKPALASAASLARRVPGVAGILAHGANLAAGMTPQQVVGLGRILVPLQPTIQTWRSYQTALSKKLKAALAKQRALRSSLKAALAKPKRIRDQPLIARIQAGLKQAAQDVADLKSAYSDTITQIKQLSAAADADVQKAAGEAEQEAASAASAGQQVSAAIEASQSALPYDLQLHLAQAAGTTDTADDLAALRGEEGVLQGRLDAGGTTIQGQFFALSPDARLAITNELSQVRQQIQGILDQQKKDAASSASDFVTAAGIPTAAEIEAEIEKRVGEQVAAFRQSEFSYLSQLRAVRQFEDTLFQKPLQGSNITVNIVNPPGNDPLHFASTIEFELKALVA